ncbi:MAG: hypothetical protein ACK5JF_07395 [Oscillospiraceae bacterium]
MKKLLTFFFASLTILVFSACVGDSSLFSSTSSISNINESQAQILYHSDNTTLFLLELDEIEEKLTAENLTEEERATLEIRKTEILAQLNP